MTRKECLEQAMGCVLRDRNNEYGEPENSFDLIADLWAAYTGHVFIGSDVAAMMALLKLARLKRNARHLDSAVDLAGYAACFAECASAETARPVPFASKAEDELEFNPGDKVQFKEHLGVKEWADARYEREHPSGNGHIVYAEGFGRIAVEPENLRPAPKAEGVEELVVSPFDEARMRESMPGIVPQDEPSCFDAPQTKEELYDRIVANNPAVFGRAHRPTGEELAEMAEEDAHG